MEKLIRKANAKINLGLKVIEKRNDGFHNIETIFYPLLLADEMIFEKSGSLKILSSSDQLNKLKTNIIEKAIKVLEDETGKKFNLKIFINKQIPLGAGLGGGSSDAACTLKAVNDLYRLDLNFQILGKLALEIGSDVPFFLNSFPAYATSRGEILKRLSFEINYPILLINPGINISTKWAFDNLKPGKPEYSLSEFVSETKFDIEKIKKYVENDFETLVFSHYPLIGQIKDELYKQGAGFALMTGSGSTVFGIFSNLQRANWAEEYFKQKNYFTFLNNPFQQGSIT